MSTEPTLPTTGRLNPRLRADVPELAFGLLPEEARRFIPGSIVLVLAAVFVLIGGGNLDLGPVEARVGLSAAEPLGPFGQVLGSWDPGTWPGQVAPSALWAWLEGGYYPTAASVRWPSAIAGILAGLILARHVTRALGPRAGVLLGLCWFASVALIDRSGGAGLDLVAGLAVLAALDRMLDRGSDLVAGVWSALAFLSGGWPPVALILLATVVMGRRGATLSGRLLIPPLLAAGLWSAWALSTTRAEAWGMALTLPLTQHPSWYLPLSVIALGLPWSPFAALAASQSVRASWSDHGRALVIGWLQIAGASILVGTIIPGLASAARLPALAGLAIVAAACLDRLWAGVETPGVRRAFMALMTILIVSWVALVVVAGIYLASAVPYYRGLAIILIVLAFPVFLVGLNALLRGNARRGVLALVLLATCLKLGHWGYYVPEWNYRFSQGPWGRAVGQWILPRWPIYATHAWSADLAFAIGRPVRQIADPRVLPYQSKVEPKFVLLFDNELENWPSDAPSLLTVARFHDEHGRVRILARTPGDASWHRLSQISHEE